MPDGAGGVVDISWSELLNVEAMTAPIADSGAA
jgi:hypothetical protein